MSLNHPASAFVSENIMFSTAVRQINQSWCVPLPSITVAYHTLGRFTGMALQRTGLKSWYSLDETMNLFHTVAWRDGPGTSPSPWKAQTTPWLPKNHSIYIYIVYILRPTKLTKTSDNRIATIQRNWQNTERNSFASCLHLSWRTFHVKLEQPPKQRKQSRHIWCHVVRENHVENKQIVKASCSTKYPKCCFAISMAIGSLHHIFTRLQEQQCPGKRKIHSETHNCPAHKRWGEGCIVLAVLV